MKVIGEKFKLCVSVPCCCVLHCQSIRGVRLLQNSSTNGPRAPTIIFLSSSPSAVAARPPSIHNHCTSIVLFIFIMTLVHPPTSVDFTSSSPQSFPFPSSGPSSNLPMLHTPPSSNTTCRPPHRQIHRNRASYSCHSCRRRKVKCDRQHPTCGNCSKMAETCVYSDNTGKGAASKEKNKNRERPTSSTSEPQDSQFIGSNSPPKRMRTTSGVPVATIGSEDDSGSNSSRSTSHSRSSSLNQADFFALNSPYQESTTLPHTPHHPMPVTSLSNIKEGELETRLAEIVGQLYRYAYTHPSSPPPTGLLSPESPVGQWPPQQLQDHPRPHGSVAKTRDHEATSSSPKSTPVQLERGLPQKSPIRTWARPTSMGPTHFATSRDGVADDALGYLSIQENGRSRYVGTSFWAILSNEVYFRTPSPPRCALKLIIIFKGNRAKPGSQDLQ